MILFVPGFMADRHLWDDVVTALGPTEWTGFADLTEGDSIEEMARRVLAAAPPQIDVAAFSMGGYVARAMARLAPERVRSLVLVATSARADTPTQARQKAAAVAQLSTVASFHGLSRSAIVASLHPDRADDEVLIQRVRAMGVRLGKEVFLRQSTLERVSDVATLAQIQCPTLVIAARDDRLRSLEEAQELRDHIPGAQLVVLEHSGHMLPMEAPHEVAQAIRTWHRAGTETFVADLASSPDAAPARPRGSMSVTMSADRDASSNDWWQGTPAMLASQRIHRAPSCDTRWFPETDAR